MIKLLSCALLLSLNCWAMNKTIYGLDNRYELNMYPDKQFQIYAYSTASMIPQNAVYDFEEPYPHLTLIFGPTLQESHELCPDVRFAPQLASASCSGFLIAPDLIATAGHCVSKKKSCEEYKWVFDYHQQSEAFLTYNSEETGEEEQLQVIVVRDSSVYNCKEIVKVKDDILGNDYAVVRLDRPVADRLPLKIRREGKIADNTPLVIIGNPSGLPTKIADDAQVLSNRASRTFSTNLDAFPGNSGSAVFNAETGEVEGILVKGWYKDFTYDKQNKCNRLTVKADDSALEHVTRITRIFTGKPEIILPQ